MKFLRLLDNKLEEVLMGILLICMVVIMCIQVACRYCLNYSLTWSEELTRYLFVWAGFISISYCVKKRISIKIEQFERLLPDKVAKVLDVFRNALLICFAIYMLPFAMRYLQQCINNGSTSSSLGIPMYYVQVAPLVGFALVAIRLIQALLESIRVLKEGGELS